jgi:hypothetical protein
MAVGIGVTIWCIVVSLRARKSSDLGWIGRCGASASWVGVQVLAFSMSYWFFSVNRATLPGFRCGSCSAAGSPDPRTTYEPAFSPAPSCAGGLRFRCRNRAHAVVELVVLYRPLGELKRVSQITRTPARDRQSLRLTEVTRSGDMVTILGGPLPRL